MSDVIFYAFAIVVMAVSFLVVKRHHRQKAAGQAPERLAEAAAHGWTYEYAQTPLFEIERWTGNTDGIAWTIEAARSGTTRSALIEGSARASSIRVTRWQTTRPIPVPGPILFLHHGGPAGPPEAISQALAEIDSPLARRLIGKVLDVGLSVRFGSPIGANVEGTALRPGPLPAIGYDGYNLLAADHSAATTLLVQRLGPALRAARETAGADALSVLITPEGLAVSVPRLSVKTGELLPIVEAGLVLTRAMTLG